MTVLGLDPGSRFLGYGLIETDGVRVSWQASGVIRLDARALLPARLAAAHSEVRRLLALHRPAHVVLEDGFVARGVRAAIVLGQVRGVLLLAAEQEGIPSIEIAPRAVKLAAAGNGGAAKQQVQAMLPRLLARCPATLQVDEADALAVAWSGATELRRRELIAAATGPRA